MPRVPHGSSAAPPGGTRAVRGPLRRRSPPGPRTAAGIPRAALTHLRASAPGGTSALPSWLDEHRPWRPPPTYAAVGSALNTSATPPPREPRRAPLRDRPPPLRTAL